MMKKPRKMADKAACVLAAALIVLASTCESLPEIVHEPVISFKDVTITGIGFDGVDLLAVFNVENGNPLSIPFPETDWELALAGTSFIKGTIPSGGGLAANAVTPVAIPLHIPYEGLYKAVPKLLSADEAAYQVNVGFRFPLPILREKTFKAEFQGSLPMLKAPSLSFRGIRFNSLNPLRVEFILTWAVENKNAFSIDLDKLGYTFTVNNSQWSQGALPRSYSLAARSTTELPITVSINSTSLLAEIMALAAGGQASYTCNGEASLRPAFPGVGNLSLPYNFSGFFDLN
jgi:LEA14-like dessication related protein